MGKAIKLIAIIILGLGFLIFIIHAYYLDHGAKREYLYRSIHGIIEEIKIEEGNRRLPTLKINNQWIFLDMPGEKIDHYIQTRDSLVKDSGSTSIKVFRKNEKNEWYVKVFK